MTNLDRRIKLGKLREEYTKGTRDRKAIELEARALKLAIKIADQNEHRRKKQ